MADPGPPSRRRGPLARRTVRCSSRWVWVRPGLGRELDPGGRDRTQSVPEAGRTGAKEVATPTTPTAGHSADSPEADGLDGR